MTSLEKKKRKTLICAISVTILALIVIFVVKFVRIINLDQEVSFYGTISIEFETSTSVSSFRTIIPIESLDAEISPEKAYQFAYPLLEKSFELRKKSRNEINHPNSVKVDHIILKGDWYYIARDGRGFYFLQAYFNHAVKVHKDTGEVIEPK